MHTHTRADESATRARAARQTMPKKRRKKSWTCASTRGPSSASTRSARSTFILPRTAPGPNLTTARRPTTPTLLTWASHRTMRIIPERTRSAYDVKPLGPKKELRKNKEGLIMPDPDPRFPEEGPDCETKVVGGHALQSRREAVVLARKALRRSFLCKTFTDLLDHYDNLMRVSTPRTQSREDAAAEKADTKPGGKNYDPLYDWSLYGREDHPRWLQFCREEKCATRRRPKGSYHPARRTSMASIDMEKTTPSFLMGTARRSTTPSTRAIRFYIRRATGRILSLKIWLKLATRRATSRISKGS